MSFFWFLILRLYTQLEYLKNKTLRQDNPHISKRRGGRKVAHRRFSLQVNHLLTFIIFAFTPTQTPTDFDLKRSELEKTSILFDFISNIYLSNHLTAIQLNYRFKAHFITLILCLVF